MSQSLKNRLKKADLGAIFPVSLLLAWHIGVVISETRLIPLPSQVAVMMWGFAFGGVYDDAFSVSLPIHFWVSIQRVYGGRDYGRQNAFASN